MNQCPTNYQEAKRLLDEKRGDKNRMKLANNTYLIRHAPGPSWAVHVKLHETVIVTFNPNGSITLNSGGWKTVTTKERMNRYLPTGFSIYQHRSVWYLRKHCGNTDRTFVFKDRIRIGPRGGVSGHGGTGDKKLQKLLKKIRTYVDGYMRALAAGKVGPPSGGDCWYCLMHMRNRDHLVSHMREKYYVPSLLMRAIEMIPVSQAARFWLGDFWRGEDNVVEDCTLTGGTRRFVVRSSVFENVAKRELRSSLYRYMKRQLGLAG